MPLDLTGGAMAPRPRIVLDSNIWIDMLVFRDPRAEPIRAALDAGTVSALIRPDCREELRRVLDYPQFARFAIDQAAALATVDGYATAVELPSQAEADAIRLPRCKDADDQKFLELAHFAGADALVSKDKAVLKMKSRLRRSSGVDVMLPAAFPAWMATWIADRTDALAQARTAPAEGHAQAAAPAR